VCKKSPITSVPIAHATPGAAASSVNRRNKYDADFPTVDNILQETLREDQGYFPEVLLGGGHPLDFENKTEISTVTPKGFTYIRQSTYNELRSKPTNISLWLHLLRARHQSDHHQPLGANCPG
jgi:alkaline phosphatase